MAASRFCFAKVANFLLIGVLLSCAGCTKAARRSRHISAGDKSFAAERYDHAEIEYRQALRIPPLDPHALGNLGLIYHAQGRWAEAVFCLNEAVKLQPNNANTRAALARCLLVMGQLKGAQAQAQAMLGQDPENTEGLLLLTASIGSTQDLASLQQAFAQVSAAGQNKAGYHLARGAFFLHQGDIARAEDEYRQELVVYPKSTEAYQALGSLLMARNNFEEAGTALKTAADLAPLHSGARLTYADWKLRTGKSAEALQDVQDHLKKVPDFLPAWLFLARAAAAEGRSDEAAGCLQKVLDRDPFNLEALSMKGTLLLARGDGTNAAGFFERIIETYAPGPPAAHYNLAAAYVMTGEEAKAVRSLNKALELQTNYADAILLLSQLNFRRGNSAAAIAALGGLVQQQPQLAQAHLDLASGYVAERRFDEAAAVYKGMRLIFTNNAEVPFHLGTVLLLQSKTNEARNAFEQSVAIAPDLLPAIEQLVLLDLAENRGPEASDRLGHLIETYPNLPLLRVLQARMYLARAGIVIAKEKHEGASGRLDFTMSSEPAVREDVDRAEAALLKAIELNRDYFPAHQLLATLYLNSNRAQQAVDHLTALLARTNDLTCLLELAAIQKHLKAYPSARTIYERVLTLQPECIPAMNDLALLLAEHLGEPERGYDLAQKARQLQPDSPYVADTLGWILYNRHDYPAALKLFQEAAKQLSGDELQCHLGLTHYMLGEEAAAQKSLNEALKPGKDFSARQEGQLAMQILAIEASNTDESTRSLLIQRLSACPRDPMALQRLASIQAREGRLNESLANYQRILESNPNNSTVLFAIARLYAEGMDRPNQALDAAKAAHAADPENPHISALLGRLVYQADDFQWASALLQDSARKLPDDLQLSYDLAWVCYSIGRVPEAIAAMRRVAQDQQFPKTQDANRFVELAQAQESPAEALSKSAAAQKILDSDPAYVPALMVSATAAEQRGDFSAAAQLYRRALARFPLFAPATRSLAILAFDHLNDDDAAYDLTAKARKSFPDDPQLIRALGILSYRRSDFSRCAQLLSPLALTTTNGEVLSYLGLAQYKLKQTARSKATLEQALTSDLPHGLAEEVKRALTELKGTP